MMQPASSKLLLLWCQSSEFIHLCSMICITLRIFFQWYSLSCATTVISGSLYEQDSFSGEIKMNCLRHLVLVGLVALGPAFLIKVQRCQIKLSVTMCNKCDTFANMDTSKLNKRMKRKLRRSCNQIKSCCDNIKLPTVMG